MANYTLSTDLRVQRYGAKPPALELNMTSRCDDTAFMPDGDECDLVSDNVTFLFKVVSLVTIVPIINVFGTATNIINVVCFVKQGVRDVVNIAFIGLTMSELLSMATLIWNSIWLNPLLYESDSAVWAPSISHLTSGAPHVAFTRVTCCMTAFITLERCLCVLLPLKVQLIFSATRVSVIVITIYIVVLTANIAPDYYNTRFAMVPHPSKPNKTWLGIAFIKDKPIIKNFPAPINNFLIPFSTFTIICISTVVMVNSLTRTRKWRKKTTEPRNSNYMSSRDRSVSRMVVLIAVMFIICYTPLCGIAIGSIVVPKLSILGQYKNLLRVIVSFAYMLESVNASFNIFIYYNMSSRYRQAFRQAGCFLCMTDRHNKLRKRNM